MSPLAGIEDFYNHYLSCIRRDLNSLVEARHSSCMLSDIAPPCYGG